jgi:hypothetical protein
MNLNRRIFLRGLGGAVVAAPFLSSVAERAAKAQGAPVSPPRRLITLFTHYGAFTQTWFPDKADGPLEAADYMSKSTAPLAPHAKKILMMRGLRAMNEWSFQGTLGQTTDPHTQVVGSYFTCQPVTPDDGKFNATPTGRSLDFVCAEQLHSDGQPLFIRCGNGRDSAQSATSYSAAGKVFNGVGSPKEVYQALTGLTSGGGGGGGGTPADYKTARGKSIFDVVRSDLEALKRVPMSGDDKRKVQDWEDLLTDVGGDMGGESAECSTASATKLEVTDQTVGASPNSIETSYKVYNSVVTLAVICDAYRVIFMKDPGAYTFSKLDSKINKDAHGLSHRQGDAYMGGRACVTGVNDMLQTIDKFYCTQFADLLAKLDSFSESDGTLLDNSAVVHFQEMSDGNSHNLNNMPIVHAGSCGGYFKTGQAINLEDSGNASMTPGASDNTCKDGGTVSTNVDGTGTPSNIGNVPYNKYFCNLMNAIGVKAGPDGFPLKGGTAPVERYGKYDNSADFKGGGTKPAKINDPGELTQIKA